MRNQTVTLALLACLAQAPLAHAGTSTGDLDCSAREITVYFQPGVADLTPEAEALIDHIAASATPCDLTAVETEAWSMDAPQPHAADDLSEARRTTVLSALAERGLVAKAHISLASQPDDGRSAFPSGRAVQASLRLATPSVS